MDSSYEDSPRQKDTKKSPKKAKDTKGSKGDTYDHAQVCLFYFILIAG